MVLLNCLLSSYPEQGYQLFSTLDYWQCRELINIVSSSKASPEDTNQMLENRIFNCFLDTHAYSRFEWFDVEGKKNLYDIKKLTVDAVES